MAAHDELALAPAPAAAGETKAMGMKADDAGSDALVAGMAASVAAAAVAAAPVSDSKKVNPRRFTIVTDQLQGTRHFYVEVLGLREGPRPPFPVAGYWLYVGAHPVLHVVAVERMPEPRRGVLDHMAFRAEGLAATLERLDKHGIAFRIIRAPGETRTWQLFCNDPNGVEQIKKQPKHPI